MHVWKNGPNQEKPLVFTLGRHWEGKLPYCSIKLLHPKYKGHITKVPAKQLVYFSFAIQGLTTDIFGEVFGAMALEAHQLREKNRELTQRIEHLDIKLNKNSVGILSLLS